ncbi:hydrolase [Collibacillus ludicampi]|uniref:Hydrolase n=1 Tax=Collibacillus ludicampi TaxID=2771369 RepID=A0AAV4LK04_9BACL|nr:NlpC/P60 family protein [Collibacillus ludicampi]GIM48124.1 hydrolase [Collibacillus ludicampi]
MKKGVRALLFAGTIGVSFLTASTAMAAETDWNVLLKKGSQGEKVIELQQDLRLLNYFTYPTNTGYYGEVTEEAVKAFQRDHGIQVNGMVGKTTGTYIEKELKARGLDTNSIQKANVVEIAKKYLGTPYQYAGMSPSGFDCSGFVKYVYAQRGVDLPRTSQEMYNTGTTVSDLKPGDLVFFSTYEPGPSHVGIYIGDNQFISATSSSGVKIDSFSNQYWGPRYIGAKRVM